MHHYLIEVAKHASFLILMSTSSVSLAFVAHKLVTCWLFVRSPIDGLFNLKYQGKHTIALTISQLTMAFWKQVARKILINLPRTTIADGGFQ